MASRFSLLSALGSALVLLAPMASAQVAFYNYDGQTPTVTTTAPNASASATTVGPGTNGVGYFGGNPGEAISSTGFNSAALDADDYFEFTATPAAGFVLNLTTITFDVRRSNSGPPNIVLRSSKDGYVANIATGTAGTGFSTVSGNVSGDALYQNSAAVTFRIFAFQATGATGTLRIDNLTLNGTVTASGGPANVTVTQGLDAVAGYRLLSTPVTGVTVDDLAAINLVQGVMAGAPAATFPAQYENAVPNLYTGYDGTSYTPAPNTGFEILPGRGFFWQLYNQNIDSGNVPASQGSGTSDSFVLTGTADLTATGPALTTDVSREFSVSVDNFYILGNPFARPLAASAISADVALQTTFQTYDPTSGSYIPVSADAMIGQTAIDVWQGLFAETSAPAAGPVTFTYDADEATPATPTFYGRPAAASGVALSLTGTTAAGAATTDLAAIVRFVDGASAGWDVADASKMTPPAGPYALLAPVLVRDGAPYRASVSTMPVAAATVPLAFLATDAGTYTLAADLAGLPEGVTAELRDVTTGAVSDLSEGYTFTSDAAEWATRFELVLTPRGATAGESGPAALSLSAAYPNPATRQSTMALTVDAAQRVTATVVDALGRTVATVFDADLAAGAEAQIVVDASRLAPGVYVVRVAGETFAEARRITVAR